MTGAEGEHMAAVANGEDVHNLIICTLCSCYPWPVLGLPPYWYKDPVFRARGVREPRAVLREFGVPVAAETKDVKVWDSSAQIRWFVVPERPANTADLSEDELAASRHARVDDGRGAGRAAGRRLARNTPCSRASRNMRRRRMLGASRLAAASRRQAALHQIAGNVTSSGSRCRCRRQAASSGRISARP